MLFGLFRDWVFSLDNLNNLKVLKRHKTKAVKNNWIQEKFISVHFYNLGLALTGSRTTWACLEQVNLKWAHDPIENQKASNLDEL